MRVILVGPQTQLGERLVVVRMFSGVVTDQGHGPILSGGESPLQPGLPTPSAQLRTRNGSKSFTQVRTRG